MYEDSYTRMARVKELTVEDKLKALYDLQQVDSKIDELRILAGELPQEVKDMSDEVEGLKTRLTNIENEIKECETQISDHRVRTENANASISRYKEQQNTVRNNREFDNLNKEIEYQELEIEASQRKIKYFTQELEARIADKAHTTKTIEERTVDLNQKRSELDQILAETKAEMESLMLKAADLSKKISCGGCHAKIPAQRQLDIRTRKKILVCEFCGRILVDPDM